ncbi:hypothetical protein TWF730_004157 [Orbilia blumenaviensis]|uniref:Metaxin n=1 Tax=Orbilia blumenaviensis TaxID=1796055 RepID=A0AAV9U024_9PEZI
MASSFPDALRAPTFIRRLFSQFPLVTHPVDPHPLTVDDFQPSSSSTSSSSSSSSKCENTLYSFTTCADSKTASFNPACLKWQTYLRIRSIPFKTQPSNNHASPSGALPFMIVSPSSSSSSSSSSERKSQTIPSGKLARWIDEHATIGSVNTVDTDGGDYRAFLSLVEGAVRDAWLYALYIDPTNLANLTVPKYTSTVPLWPIPHLQGAQMRQAAINSIRTSSSSSKTATPSGTEIYDKAAEAFSALSTLLAGDTWFFGAAEAGVFDAEVFAYTHLLLTVGDGMKGSSGEGLVSSLRGFENLCGHEERIRRRWFS